MSTLFSVSFLSHLLSHGIIITPSVKRTPKIKGFESTQPAPSSQPQALTAPPVVQALMGASPLPCSEEPQTQPGSLASHTFSPSAAGFSWEPHLTGPCLSVPVATASPPAVLGQQPPDQSGLQHLPASCILIVAVRSVTRLFTNFPDLSTDHLIM